MAGFNWRTQVMPLFVRNCGCFSHAHYNASVILNKGVDKGSHSSKSRDKLWFENLDDLTSDLPVVVRDRSIQFQAKMSEEVKSGKERRKASKPIMEKRRRARINESLNELKSLILEAMKKDNSCYSKLEKADILEMTVQHLKNLKNQQSTGSSSSNPVFLANYRAGFNQCASEITRVLTGLGNTDSTLRSRLLEHLATRCLLTKPMDAADTRGQLPQVSFPNQPILPKPPISVSSPGNFSFLPQSSPIVLPSTQYHLASYPLTNGKVALLLPTVNPFLMDNISSSAAATQPGLIPVFGKDPKHSMSPPEVMPLGLDTRSLLWKPFA